MIGDATPTCSLGAISSDTALDRPGSSSPRRLAVYAAPRRTSPLGQLAASWLGRDIDGGDDVGPRPDLGQHDIDDLTEEARGYGFHATLKPPFRLADGVEPADVDRRVSALAASRTAIELPGLVVDLLSGFAALRPTTPIPLTDDLAAACVTELDDLRHPPDDLELARRRRAGLTPGQDELLARYGYPYVLDEFRYHMTLTRRLGPPEREPVLAAAREWFGPVDGEPFVLEELCVASQTAPGEPFVVVARHRLGTGDRIVRDGPG